MRDRSKLKLVRLSAAPGDLSYLQMFESFFGDALTEVFSVIECSRETGSLRP